MNLNEELKRRGIDPKVWADPECHGDKERALFWEMEARETGERETAARITLARNLKCPAIWESIFAEIGARSKETDQLFKEVLRVMRADGLHRGTEGRKSLWKRLSNFRKERSWVI